MTALTPLTPKDCDLRDFPAMMVHIDRLLGSEFDAVSTDTEWRLGVTLWMRSFHQAPAGSLPADDVSLAKLAGLGRAVTAWKKVREGALRGWALCADGRLYHPVVAEVVLEAWLSKLAQRVGSALGNAKRWKTGEADERAIRERIWAAAERLRAINPHAETLKKQYVIKSDPAAIPVGSHQDSRRDPGGNPTAVPREGKGIKDRSLGPSEPKRPIRRAGERARPDGHARPPSGPPPVWRGPPEIRAAFVTALGEGWAATWLDPQGWADVPQRAIVCRTGTALSRIRQAAFDVLRDLGVDLIRDAPQKAAV